MKREEFIKAGLGMAGWASPESIVWMRESIDILKKKYPGLKYTCSFTGAVTEQTKH